MAVSCYLKQILAYMSGELPIMETTRDENGGETAARALAEAKEDYKKLQNEFLVMMLLQEMKVIEAKEHIQKLCSHIPQDPTPHTQSNVLHHPTHPPFLSNNLSPNNPRFPLSQPTVLGLPAHPITPYPLLFLDRCQASCFTKQCRPYNQVRVHLLMMEICLFVTC